MKAHEMRIFLLALAFFMFPLNAKSQNNTMDAENLLKVCTTPSMHWVDFCNGFFQAVHDQVAIVEVVCVPQGTTRTEIVELFEREATQLLQKDPTIGKKPGVVVAQEILGKAYQCK